MISRSAVHVVVQTDSWLVVGQPTHGWRINAAL